MEKISKLFRTASKGRYFYPVFIFSLSFLLRLAYVYLFEAEITPGDDPYYYLRIVKSILQGGGYREINLLAYRPPLYPYFIAGIFSVFGNNINTVRIVQAVLAVIMCSGIFFIGKSFLTPRIGLIASFFCAIYPQLIHYSVQLWSEQLFIFFVVLATLSFLLSEQKGSLLWKIVTGIMLGFSALTREAGVLVLFGLLIWLILVHRKISVGLKRWWILALFTLITISPWTIRNYLVFKRFVLINTNGGINFYMGNNPEATGTFKWATPPGARFNEKSANGYYETEASYLGYREGIRYIINNPSRELTLTVRRVFYLLKPPLWSINFKESRVETLSKLIWLVMYIFLFIFALIIGPFYIRFEPKFLSLFFITIFMLALPFLITFAATRFRLPMEPFMALIAAVVVDRMFLLRKG